jgi:hypothetical protein
MIIKKFIKNYFMELIKDWLLNDEKILWETLYYSKFDRRYSFLIPFSFLFLNSKKLIKITELKELCKWKYFISLNIRYDKKKSKNN